jgi:hypothetical protein
VNKADWLEKALDVLESDGIDEVKVERLAKEVISYLSCNTRMAYQEGQATLCFNRW